MEDPVKNALQRDKACYNTEDSYRIVDFDNGVIPDNATRLENCNQWQRGSW